MAKKSYHEFVIKGLNQESFFNKLSSSFNIFDINRYERNKTSFKVDLKNGKKVKKMILSCGFELLGEKKCGIFARMLELRHCYGLLAGIILSIVVYICQLPILWRVCIDGVSDEVKTEISQFIEENYTLSKKDLNCKQLEIDLRKHFDNLSFASVAIIGQSLVVNAKEGETPSEKTEIFEPIICEFDCKIESINLIQGTLNVRVGDIIRKGEVLVFPYIIDASGEEKKVEPKAVIKIQTWITSCETHKEEEYVWKRSGESYVENKLFLFGLEIYSHNSEKKFKNFESETSQKPFSKNNILPFIYKKTTYYEMIEVLEKKSYESVKDAKVNAAREKALQNILECDKIINEKYTENVIGDLFTITYHITIEKELCFK